MKISILDDYQDAIRTLDCFATIGHHEVTVWNDHTSDVDVLAKRLEDTEALLLIRERTPITAPLLDRLGKLRLISQFGRVPHIDLEACTRRGVLVCSRTVPGQPSYATAELTWGLIIAALRRIPQETAALKAGLWQTPASMGQLLRGRTLGIYGYGRIGATVAGYGKAFGMHVMAWGRDESLQRARSDGCATPRTKAEFFESCDVFLCPTLCSPPLRIGELNSMSKDLSHIAPILRRYIPATSMFNMSGQPAMSMPLAWNRGGLPLGMMFSARLGDEATLFRLAAQLEQERPWRGKLPPICA